jgi:uncharacterized protein YhfF
MRPLKFSPDMLQAIREGRKTQTRRPLKDSTEFAGPYNPLYIEAHKHDEGWADICPYGKVRDIIEYDDCAIMITKISVARLQQINESDAIAEGFRLAGHGDDWRQADSFRKYWNSIYKENKFKWKANPYVWVIRFRKVAL